jgi:hypothetical protein
LQVGKNADLPALPGFDLPSRAGSQAPAAAYGSY